MSSEVDVGCFAVFKLDGVDVVVFAVSGDGTGVVEFYVGDFSGFTV